MFMILGIMIYVTMISNPSRPVQPRGPFGSDPVSVGEGEKTWKRVFAELYGPNGLEKTWEVATPKGFFDEADREDFMRRIPAEKRFGEVEMTVKEEGEELIFGIYPQGARP